MRKDGSPRVGDSVEVDYPTTALDLLRSIFQEAEEEARQTLAQWHRPARVFVRLPSRRHPKQPLGFRKLVGGYLAVRINHEAQEPSERFAFAHVLSWEVANGRKLPPGHVVVMLDGNKLNCDPKNLYCLPKSDFKNWLRFVRCPVDVHLDNLWRQVVALDIPAKLKQSVLDRLEQVTDPAQTPDLVRQRAVCELVQSFVNIIRAEISYLRAINGDGKIPALEGSRERLSAKAPPANRPAELTGPAADHPWRGLGGGKE